MRVRVYNALLSSIIGVSYSNITIIITTSFVFKIYIYRDLPFDATSSDIKRAFGKFGHIEMAIIVKDKMTGISKGSAFVKFMSSSAAQDCVRYAESGVQEGNSAGTGTGAAAGCSSIMVHDRPCRVDLAVDRDQAEKLKLDNKKALAKVGNYGYFTNSFCRLSVDIFPFFAHSAHGQAKSIPCQ